MIGGTIAVVVIGVIKADGFTNIYNVSKTGGRLDIEYNNFDRSINFFNCYFCLVSTYRLLNEIHSGLFLLD